MPFFSTSSIERSILLGNFNYQILSRSSSGVPDTWKSYLSSLWIDCITSPGACPSSTFLRNSSRSCLNYIFMPSDLYPFTSSPLIDFINLLWTDHHLVSVELRLGQAPLGPGLWRCNPTLATDKHFCSDLSVFLTSEIALFDTSLSQQQKWDQIKLITGKFARKYSRKKRTHNQLHLRSLQKERRQYLSFNNHIDIHHDPYLISLEAEIASVQSDFTHINALYAGLQWREHSEK